MTLEEDLAARRAARAAGQAKPDTVRPPAFEPAASEALLKTCVDRFENLLRAAGEFAGDTTELLERLERATHAAELLAQRLEKTAYTAPRYVDDDPIERLKNAEGKVDGE